VGYEKNLGFWPVLAFAPIVNSVTVRCCRQSAARPWQVSDTHCLSFCTALEWGVSYRIILWPCCRAMLYDIGTNIETVSCPCNTCFWYTRALAVRNTSRGVSFTVALVICKLQRIYVTSGTASVYFDDADNATCKSRVGLPYSVLPVAERTIFGFGCAIQPCNTHSYCIVVTSWHCVLHHKLAIKWNTDRDLHMPYSRVLFRMTLSDLEWLSEIFSDTKHRAVSLW